MMKTLRRPQFRYGVIVIVLILAWYFLFSFRPIAMSLRIALSDYQLLHPGSSPWVGVKHFQTLLFDYSLFWKAVQNTAVYTLLITVVTVPLALLLSSCLAQVVRGRAFYQAAVFMPVVVSMAAVALMFRHLMDPNGILNHLLRDFGFPPYKWLVGADSAMPSIAAIEIWKGLGGNVVILLAGLLAIPKEFYDAAEVDGAGTLQRFRHITLPLLSPVLKLVIIIIIIGSLQAYTGVIILTNGGPARATLMMNQFVVSEAFDSLRLSLAASASFFLFFATLAITVFQLRLMRSKWEY